MHYAITLFLCVLYVYPDKFISITLDPLWHNLDATSNRSKQFGDKWILIGQITFKKKHSRDSIYLHRLRLSWHGPFIEHLSGSLYKKNFDPTKKEFIPIDEYLVCDGIWNKKKQTFILTFEEKQTLGAIQVFYVVLVVSQEIEALLKQGTFTLDKADLPEPFLTFYSHSNLTLALDSR